jgi:hypothetical protein
MRFCATPGLPSGRQAHRQKRPDLHYKPAAKPNVTKREFLGLIQAGRQRATRDSLVPSSKNNLFRSRLVGLITCDFGPARVMNRKRDGYSI